MSLFIIKVSKYECKDQESIQSSTNGKETKSQLHTTNESQEVSPFPAGDHKAQINIHAQKHCKHKQAQDRKKKYRLGTVSKIFYWM